MEIMFTDWEVIVVTSSITELIVDDRTISPYIILNGTPWWPDQIFSNEGANIQRRDGRQFWKGD